MVCSKCFETNEAGAEFCSDCGAPLKEGSDGSDQEVYKDLSRANLLRMRGDHKAASDVCLGILRRFPNNFTANSLLGDICVDQGDLVQAETWYEMALDLNPESKVDRDKLASVRERIAAKDTTTTAEKIGLPTSSPSYGFLFGVVAFLLIAVAAAAYFAGKTGSQGENSKQTTTQVIKSEPTIEQQPLVQSPKDTKDSLENETKFVPVTKAATTDQALLNTLQSRAAEKVHFLSITEDPRGQYAILSIEPVDGEALGISAMRAGLEFYDVFPAFKRLTIRVLSKDGIAFVGDMSNDSAVTAKAAINGGDTIESQAQVSLSNTWTPPHEVGNSDGASQKGN